MQQGPCKVLGFIGPKLSPFSNFTKCNRNRFGSFANETCKRTDGQTDRQTCLSDCAFISWTLCKESI